MSIVKGSDWGGSRINTAQTCKRKYYNRYVRPTPEGVGLIQIEDKGAASKGSVIHAGLQHYYNAIIAAPDGNRAESAVDAIHHAIQVLNTEFSFQPEIAGLLRDEIIAALDQYFQHYAVEDLIPIATEVPVAIEIPGIDGNMHTHTGIIDLVAEHLGGLFIVDHKTTSMGWDMLFKKYTFSLSFKGYCKAARPIYGKEIGALVNGIRFKKNKALEVELMREPIMYSPQELDEFEPTVLSVLREIQSCEIDGFWPKSDAQCVQVWGTCEYFPLCKFDDPAMVATKYKTAKKNE